MFEKLESETYNLKLLAFKRTKKLSEKRIPFELKIVRKF